MVITEEMIAEWYGHPVTRLHRDKVKELIKDELDIRTIPILETSTLEDLGVELVARANYVRGLEDALEAKQLLEVDDD